MAVNQPIDASFDPDDIGAASRSASAGRSPSAAGIVPPALRAATAAGNAVPLAWGCTVHYEFLEGIVPALLADEKGTPAVFWRPNSGGASKVVSFVAQFLGDKPKLPAPDTRCDNEVLLSRHVSAAVPSVSVDGSLVWTVTAQYVYALQKPPGPNDPLPIGGSPFSSLPAETNTINPGDYFPFVRGRNPSGFSGRKIDY